MRHKQQGHRSRRWSDRRQAPREEATELFSHVPVSEDTLHAIQEWLTWITEEELHQPVQQQIEHPTQEYHRYLESTYAMRSLHHDEDSQVKEGMIIDLQTETVPNPSCLPLKNETKEFTDSDSTWPYSSTAQPSVTHFQLQQEGTPASPFARVPVLRRHIIDILRAPMPCVICTTAKIAK